MKVNEKCRSCNETMRPRRAKVTDWPGTRAYHGKGICGPCYVARKANRPAAGHRPKEAPKRCRQCDHPMRTYRKTVEEAPGTLAHDGKGLCHTCYVAESQGRIVKPRDMPQFYPCLGGCGRITRPRSMKAADAPEGSRQRIIGGLCLTCATPEARAKLAREREALARWRRRNS